MTRTIRAMRKREVVESEIDLELKAHIEMETEDLIRAGLSAEEARRQASIVFGGIQQTREQAMEEATSPLLEAVKRDWRIAWRSLVRHRRFSIAAILALSLVIAVNTTMFNVIDGMLNPAVGVRNPDSIYELRHYGNARKRIDPLQVEGLVTSVVGGPNLYTQWAGYGSSGVITRNAHHADRAYPIKVRPNFFAMLGIQPAEGRLAPGADNGSARSSIVISTRLRAILFTKSESPIGQTVLIDDVPFTVVGVLPRVDPAGALGADAWFFSRPDESLLIKYVRLPDDMTLAQLDQRLAALAARLERGIGEDPAAARFLLKQQVLAIRSGEFHYALIGAGLAILIVACTNLANLQLARGLTRTAELAVRSSLGASRRQIVSQLMFESAALAIVALVIAIGLSFAGNELVRAFVPPAVGPYIIEPKTSWRMLPMAGIAALLCVVAIGLFPALHISRVELNKLLKGRAGTGAHRSNRRIYSFLVIAQIALTLPLTSAAVLLSISAWQISDYGFIGKRMFGYDPRPLGEVVVKGPRNTGPGKISIGIKAAQLITRVRTVPGVVSATVYSKSRIADEIVTVEMTDGTMREAPAPLAFSTAVTPDYIKTYGYRISAGRDFQDTDSGTSAVIVDDFTVERLWPQTNPVGRTIKLGKAGASSPVFRVVGVITEALDDDAREMRRYMNPKGIGEVYRPMRTDDSVSATQDISVTFRAAGDASAYTEPVRRAMTDGNAPPFVTTELEQLQIPDMAIQTRFMAALFVVFGVIGLGLSVLGIYALVAQSAADRRREVAVRIALGATPGKIVYALLREGNVLILGGIAIGLFLTKQTMELIATFTGAVELTNSLLYGALCLGLFALMAMAALWPAIQATRLDPMEVLRAE